MLLHVAEQTPFAKVPLENSKEVDASLRSHVPGDRAPGAKCRQGLVLEVNVGYGPRLLPRTPSSRAGPPSASRCPGGQGWSFWLGRLCPAPPEKAWSPRLELLHRRQLRASHGGVHARQAITWSWRFALEPCRRHVWFGVRGAESRGGLRRPLCYLSAPHTCVQFHSSVTLAGGCRHLSPFTWTSDLRQLVPALAIPMH